MARSWLTRLRLLFWRRDRDDRDLDDEIRFHLAQEAQLRIEAGAPTGEAWASARRDFGNVRSVKEVARAMRGSLRLETFGQDVRFGLRLLGRSRLFAFFSIASLALGIGATTAIFSLFDAIVLRSLPVREPDRLVTLGFQSGGNRPNNYFSYPLFSRLREANTTLDGLFAWTTRQRIGAAIDGRTDIVSAGYVSGDYYPTLGIRPALGRLLTTDDDRRGNATSVVLGHGYWQRRFAGAPTVIGARITVDEFSYTVVGVEPRGFVGTNVGFAPDVVFPLRASSNGAKGSQPWDSRNWTWIEVIGRLKAGVTSEQAQQELTSIFRAMAAETASPSSASSPATPQPIVFVESGAGGGQSSIRRNYQQPLRLMFMMLLALVLLASLNLATLLLARAEARRDEMAMRLALGAGRWRLVRQLLTESALVAAAGGALGLFGAWWGSQALLRVAVRDTDAAIDLTPDLRVLGFTVLMSAITCVFFGVLPALRSTAALRASGRYEVRGRGRRRLERTLVASQTALSLVLLVFMALFVRSLENLWARDPGYIRSNVAMFSTDARLAGKKGDAVAQTYRLLLDALRALPGVRQASISTVPPVSTNMYFVGGVGRLGDLQFTGDRRIRVATNTLSPGYFETMGIPLVAGRDFDVRDNATSPKVVIVSERLASKFAGAAVGQTLDSSAEVIGVAKDNRYARVKDAPRDVVYMPVFQNVGNLEYPQTFEIRYDGDTAALFRSIRSAAATIDPGLTLFNLNTLERYTSESLSQERLLALASTYMGGFALLLAAIGLYGLLMYTVTERTPEIGLRMALGSPPSSVRTMVLRDGAATIAAGIALGFACALWVVRFAQAQIVDIRPIDPASFALATATLGLVAATAAWLPARRASRIDPIVALRHE